MATRDMRRPRIAPAARGALVELQSLTVRLYSDGTVEGHHTRLDPRSRRLVTENLFQTDAVPCGENPMAELLELAARTHTERQPKQLPLW